MEDSAPNQVDIGGSLGRLFTGFIFIRLGYEVAILESTVVRALKDQGARLSMMPGLPANTRVGLEL